MILILNLVQVLIKEDNSVMIGGLSETGLNKDPNFIKIEKQLDKTLKRIETKKKKNKIMKKILKNTVL